MAKIITYKCDLCGYEKDDDRIYGVYFTGYGDREHCLRSEVTQANKHICKECVEAVKKGVDKS